MRLPWLSIISRHCQFLWRNKCFPRLRRASGLSRTRFGIQCEPTERLDDVVSPLRRRKWDPPVTTKSKLDDLPRSTICTLCGLALAALARKKHVQINCENFSSFSVNSRTFINGTLESLRDHRRSWKSR